MIEYQSTAQNAGDFSQYGSFLHVLLWLLTVPRACLSSLSFVLTKAGCGDNRSILSRFNRLTTLAPIADDVGLC